MKQNILKLLLIIMPFISIMFLMKACEKSRQKSSEYRGVVVEIYTDPENRSQWTYRIQTGSEIRKESAQAYSGSFDYIEVGDSIIKRKNELLITIKKEKYNFNRMTRFHYYE